MEPTDYDDPAVEERWCSERRSQVADYLSGQGVNHGRIGEWPAWHVAPYVSIWAIESMRSPGSVGWWVISGDLPTDYVSADTIKHPREAIRAISARWLEVAGTMRRGGEHPEVTIGGPADRGELASLLETRATALAEYCDDDGVWDSE